MLSSLLGHVDTRQVAFASGYPRRMQNGVDWVYASAASRAGSIAATKLARFAVRSVTKSAVASRKVSVSLQQSSASPGKAGSRCDRFARTVRKVNVSIRNGSVQKLGVFRQPSRNRATFSGIGSSDCALHSRSFAVRSPLFTAQRTWAGRTVCALDSTTIDLCLGLFERGAISFDQGGLSTRPGFPQVVAPC